MFFGFLSGKCEQVCNLLDIRGEEFQFLKGKCEHVECCASNIDVFIEFQFLIGKCEPSRSYRKTPGAKVFQFLKGKCELILYWDISLMENVSIPQRQM